VNADTSTGEFESSRLWREDGGEGGIGVEGFDPNRDANGLVMREGTALGFELVDRLLGRGGRGGLFVDNNLGGKCIDGE